LKGENDKGITNVPNKSPGKHSRRSSPAKNDDASEEYDLSANEDNSVVEQQIRGQKSAEEKQILV